MTTSKAPPHNRDAEQAILAAMLYDGSHCGLLLQEGLSPEHYYDEGHRRIFAAIATEYQTVGEVDLVLLVESLRESGDLETVGGATYLAELLDMASFILSASPIHYLRILTNYKWRREIAAKSLQLHNEAMTIGPLDDSEEAARELQAYAREINVSPKDTGLISLGSTVQATLQALEDISSGVATPGISTGHPAIDVLLNGGYHKGESIIISGAPKSGKSAFAFNVAFGAACPVDGSVGLKVGMFSMEMSRQMLFLRALANRLMIPYNTLQTGKYTKNEYERIKQMGEAIEEVGFFVDDSGGMTIDDLLSRAQYAAGMHDLDMLVIDYLQLIRKTSPKESREEHLSRCSSEIKSLASELKLPIITIASLNNAGMQAIKEDGKPMPHHMRGSGQIQYDGDVISFLIRRGSEAEWDDPDCHTVRVDHRIEYQRNGGSGTVELNFNKIGLSFEEAGGPTRAAWGE